VKGNGGSAKVAASESDLEKESKKRKRDGEFELGPFLYVSPLNSPDIFFFNSSGDGCGDYVRTVFKAGKRRS
jgi:hypothetical protein